MADVPRNTHLQDDHKFDIRKYHVYYETGFMLRDPLKLLPTYFEPWNKLAGSLPALVRDRKLRDSVHELPLLDHRRLVGHHQLRLAHLQLSFITACYVWQDGDKGITQVLPRSVAIPYCKISDQLGIKPILSHADLVLANWALVNANGPIEFENLECLYHLPGGLAADWFCIVTFMVEFSFVKCVKAIVRILNLLEYARTHQTSTEHEKEAGTEIAKCLQEVRGALKAMEDSLGRMRDHLDAKMFFNVIRPFLGGWGGEGSPLSDGLIYEGVSNIPIKLTGGSAAQSTTLQVLDSLLGIEHTQDKREFLIKMRDFMPPEHRHFIEYMEQLPYTLRDFVTSSTNNTLKSCYNDSLSALIDLRDYHIKIVKMYIVLPSRRENEGKYESLDKKGTGGTSLVPFLKDIWSDTREKLLPTAHQTSDGTNKSWNVATLTFNIFIVAAAVIAVGFAARSVIRG